MKFQLVSLLLINVVALSAFAGTSFKHRFAEGEIIVKLKFTPGLSGNSQHERVSSSHGMRIQHAWFGTGLGHYKVAAGKTVEDAVAEMNQDPAVEYAEPNYIMTKSALENSQGPIMTQSEAQAVAAVMQQMTAQTLALQNGNQASATGGNQAQSLALTAAPIQAVQSWPLVAGSSKPIVAIIDTGADLTHPALSNSFWVNTREIANNQIDDDGNGYVDDVNGWNFSDNNNDPTDCDGHGTHVAGIVRGVGQNLLASPVPAPIIQIMPVKFMDCTGSGSTASAISAINYATLMGAKIMNNSWGGGTYSRALQEAINQAYAAKALFVVAAGNAAANNDAAPTYPANYTVPNVLAVSATDSADYLASFSNFGLGSVSVGAPGVSILSTYLNNSYTTLSGTSMAAPFISGVAALMLINKPTMPAYQLKQILSQSVDQVVSLKGKTQTGGRLNSLTTMTNVSVAVVNLNQPAYNDAVSSQDRSLASALAGQSGGGCGTVHTLGESGGAAGTGGMLNGENPIRPFGIAFLVAIPIAVWYQMRKNAKARKPAERRFDRYAIESVVRIKVGDQELEGKVGTISIGGAAIEANVLLSQGSVIAFQIQSPDGTEQVEVKGQVVWSTVEKQHGIEFVGVADAVKSTIASWTAGLIKV